MTGNIVLDMVIGLVFIFLLYSLLASIIQEIIATFLGLRARNLKHGISRMLEDGSPRKNKHILEDMVLDTKASVKRTFSSKEEGLIKKFYEEPVIKYLGSGRYFSKPSYMDKSDFSKAIIDILKKEAKGDGTDVIAKISDALSDEANAIGTETKAHLKSLLDDAGNDIDRFKKSLEGWFDGTMERVSGWYKRRVQLTLLTIGFVLAVVFNVNTIKITQLLSNDKDARDNMVSLASAYVEENKELVDLHQNDKDSIVQDSSKMEFNTKLDALLKVKQELEADMQDANYVLGFRTVDSLGAQKLPDVKATVSGKHELSPRQIIYGNQYLVEFPSAYLAKETGPYYRISETTLNDNEKVYHAEFRRFGYAWDNIWGYLITALAISLGAPFWFDLLNKFIKMRTAVQKSPTSS